MLMADLMWPSSSKSCMQGRGQLRIGHKQQLSQRLLSPRGLLSPASPTKPHSLSLHTTASPQPTIPLSPAMAGEYSRRHARRGPEPWTWALPAPAITPPQHRPPGILASLQARTRRITAKTWDNKKRKSCGEGGCTVPLGSTFGTVKARLDFIAGVYMRSGES